jgi:DnaJ-like protein
LERAAPALFLLRDRVRKISLEMDREIYQKLFHKLRIDPFEFMSLPRSCTSAELKKRYRSMARELHPDRLNDAGTDDFKILNACYMYLADTVSESRDLSGGHDPKPRPNGPNGRAPDKPWLKPVSDNCIIEDGEREAYGEDIPEQVTFAPVREGILKPAKTDLPRFNRIFEAQKQDYISRRGHELTVWKEPQAMESSEKLDYATVRQSGDVMLVHDQRNQIRPGTGADLGVRSELHFPGSRSSLHSVTTNISNPTTRQHPVSEKDVRRALSDRNQETPPVKAEPYADAVRRMENRARDQIMAEQRSNRDFLERHIGKFTRGIRELTL